MHRTVFLSASHFIIFENFLHKAARLLFVCIHASRKPCHWFWWLNPCYCDCHYAKSGHMLGCIIAWCWKSALMEAIMKSIATIKAKIVRKLCEGYLILWKVIFLPQNSEHSCLRSNAVAVVNFSVAPINQSIINNRLIGYIFSISAIGQFSWFTSRLVLHTMMNCFYKNILKLCVKNKILPK